MKPQIETLDINSLIPYARNARTHSEAQIAQIAGSIKEFGFTNPILIDKDNGIIAGHGRVAAARKLNLTEVPCIRLEHLSETQRKAYILADNRIALNSGWETELLSTELEELKDLGVNLESLGFDSDEIDALLNKIEPTAGLTDEDEAPEVQEQAVTKPGDIWVMGNHRLMCGDSTSIDAVDKLMAGERASFCFTSPPYNLGKSVGLRNGARKGADSAYNDFEDNGEWKDLMRGFINNAMSTSDVVCVNVQMLAGNKVDLLTLFGDYRTNTIDIAIWSKTNPPPAMADGVMTSSFEFMWFLSDEEEPSRRIKSASFKRGTFSNVFEHSTASGHDASVHGAVFPVSIAEHYIKNCSQPKSMIVDFFGGTGTTLIATEKNSRVARLMELDPKYCDVIVKRWQRFTGKKAILEQTGQTYEELTQPSGLQNE